MMQDSEGLFEIANTDRPDRIADVVFVHGLGGGSHTTWCHGKKGTSDFFFWPERLGNARPKCGVWTFGYAAGITALGNPGMIIEKRAGNFASQLVLKGLGERPLVFIAHSMGGLVVKSLIVASQLTQDVARKRLVGNIRGVVFCGTPHRGSAFASAAAVLGAFLGRQAHVKEMDANAEQLDLLHDHFLAWHQDHPITIASYAESIGLFRKRWFFRPVPLGLVVPRTSANPGVGVIHDVDADHLTLVKPTPSVPAIHDLIFPGVLRFINNSLGSDAAQAERHSTEQDSQQSAAPVHAEVASNIRLAPTKLPATAKHLIGREAELAMLDETWDDPHKNVVVVRGKGGEGKTSLVAAWMAELTMKDWRGAECVLDWSFYSQGTRDQSTASGETFIISALGDFGDPDPNAGGPEERGARLARLVGERRGLLVLDGLEPLQYPPGPMHGQLHDKGIAALLKGLAGQNAGLCVVTTREKVDEIQQHYGKSAIDHSLEFLSPEAGAALLHHSGAQRAGEKFPITADDEELQQASREVQGHALTLFLIGQYLRLTEQGDIRRRDRLKLAEAEAEYQNDATRPYGHAFKAIEAYDRWFAAGDD